MRRKPDLLAGVDGVDLYRLELLFLELRCLKLPVAQTGLSCFRQWASAHLIDQRSNAPNLPTRIFERHLEADWHRKTEGIKSTLPSVGLLFRLAGIFASRMIAGLDEKNDGNDDGNSENGPAD